MKQQFLNYPYWRHKILPSALQILYRPWLISLGLHGLLLMVALPDHPLSESPKPLREIKVTDLPASPKGSTKPASESASTPKPTRNASVPRQNTVIPSSSPKPTPSATPTPKPTPSVTPTPEPTPSVTPTPGVKIKGGELDEFLKQLTANDGMSPDKASKPSPDLFAEPDSFFDQLGFQPKPKTGILTMRLINGKTPVQVQNQVLSSQGKGRNFRSEQLDDYGGGHVYKVLQDSKVWYFNLVPAKDSSGTMVVVWKRDPHHLR